MDLTSDIFTSIFSPLAAFIPPSNETPESATSKATSTAIARDSKPDINDDHNQLTPWQTSPLNPQSRLDSIAPILPPPSSAHADGSTHLADSQSTAQRTPASTPIPPPGKRSEAGGGPAGGWRIDITDTTARRFFATPHFALGKPPLRIDVYLPPVEAYPPSLREVVKPERAIYHRRSTGGGTNVADLEVGRWLLRVLWRWSNSQSQEHNDGEGWLKKKWWSLPFGSRIEVDVSLGSGREEVCLVPEYAVEQGMVTVEALKKMWEGEVDLAGVEVVEWERLRFGRQVHEVISLITVEGDGGDEKEVVFKCVLQEQRYMYNELKMLLSLAPHPHVISRPLGIVTKKGRFGNRRGVCGFLLEWFPMGSLKDRLLRDDYFRTTSISQRLRWARQVTEAFIHVNRHEKAGSYPDLKPDNVVLREDADTGMLDAVLIDLEQRGGWFAWSPPEVAYLEYLEILVDDFGLPDGDLKNEILEGLREYHGDADWSPTTCNAGRYYNTEGGFSSPWLALLRERKANGPGRDSLERAQVFMLGKLLWCILEGQPLVRCGIDHEVLRDANPDYESTRSGRARAFPDFKNTPDELRRLIHACTAGAPEWEADHRRPSGVVLRGGRLYPAASGAHIRVATAGETVDAAIAFWAYEIKQARALLRTCLLSNGRREGERGLEHNSPASNSAINHLKQAQRRPLLSEVLKELRRIEPCL